MSHNILIAPDKFKGTLTAREAASAIADGWRRARPDDSLDLLPMSDGGDGFGELLGAALGAEARTVETVDAAHRPCVGRWWWVEETKTALVESANVIGLAMLPKGEFHPHELDTQGLGEVLKDVARAGAKRCVIGIGGSATNDGGTGMARRLGWRFISQGRSLERWPELNTLESVQRPAQDLGIDVIEVAVDVQNPLTGEMGCSAVYGPQKGLLPDEIELADAAIRRLAEVTCAALGLEPEVPGDGAAGGLGLGLRCFVGGRLRPGFELFADQIGFDARLAKVDLVITGEGSIDRSTLMGKGVGELAALCGEKEIPCIGLAGVAADAEELLGRFSEVAGIVGDVADEQEALAEPAECLARLAAKVAAGLQDR